MGAIIGLMSADELDRGMEIARIAGEMSVVSDVVAKLEMPVLALFLAKRGALLEEIAVDQLLRSVGTRALSKALKETAQDIQAMGEQEIGEGVVRTAVASAAADRSDELSLASDLLAARGLDALGTAAVAADFARTAIQTGVSDIAAGAEGVGSGKALEAMGEALEQRAQQ
jgi:hypothetical protein